MKIKRLLIGMLACSAMVACTNDDLLENPKDPQNGEKAFIAVNIVNSNANSRGTGVDDDGNLTFDNGTADENAFDNATFFFFDNSGNPYIVSDGKSYVTKTEDEMGMQGSTGNVEEFSSPVLVINKSQNVPPQKLLVVLNAPSTLTATNPTLSSLRDAVAAYGLTVSGNDKPKVTYTSGSKFVISNSVYKNETTGAVVDAVDLTAANIAPDANTANDNPVIVYVERTVAKVKVTDVRTGTATSVEETVKDEAGNDVAIHAQIVGWKVTNITDKTNLLKKINTNWTDATLGLTWNNAANYRSYWADTEDKDVVHPWTYNELTNEAGASDYYFENTKEDNKSQLLVAVKLVASTDVANTSATGVTICEWFGTKYTLNGLKTEIANSLNTQIYYKDTKASILPDHITFYQESDDEESVTEKRYVSYATLDNEDNTLTDETFIDADGDALTLAEVNEKLATIHPALIWNGGMSYYYIDIEHFGEEGTTTAVGLVRNHLYDITISKIKGLGTPVYDPTKIITPEKPVDEYSFISAKINILAWKLVKQNVTLQ